jgi:hypothetical protein
MRGVLPFHAPRTWGPDTPGDGAHWGPHMCGAPLVRCATHKEGSVVHITGCATATYLWSTETGCVVDNGPMDKGFPSSVGLSTVNWSIALLLVLFPIFCSLYGL